MESRPWGERSSALILIHWSINLRRNTDFYNYRRNQVPIYVGAIHHRLFKSLWEQFHAQATPDFRAPVWSVSVCYRFLSLSCHQPWCSRWQLSAVITWGWADGTDSGSLWHACSNFLAGRGLPLYTFGNLLWLTASSVTMVTFHYRSWWIPERSERAA